MEEKKNTQRELLPEELDQVTGGIETRRYNNRNDPNVLIKARYVLPGPDASQRPADTSGMPVFTVEQMMDAMASAESQTKRNR